MQQDVDRDALSFYDAAGQLPAKLAESLCRIPGQTARKVTEIRLRSERPVVLTTAMGALLADGSGAVWPVERFAAQGSFYGTAGTRLPQPDGCGITTAERSFVPLRTSHAELSECFSALCGYSVHSFAGCIAQGFVPVPGGHRAGICGTALTENGALSSVKNITSVDLRIARAGRTECSPELARLLLSGQGIVLAGAPGSGKTTLLRAAVRTLSEKGRRVAVVDERFEIAPVEQAGFAVPLPLHCDVLSGYPKHIGMLHALRSMSPDVLVCDEIGGMEDVHAVEQAANAGVQMLVTLHGATGEELLRRPQMRALLATEAFSQLVFLQGASAPGHIREVQNVCSLC